MLIWNQSGGAPDSHLKYTDVSLKFPEFNKINQKSYLMIVISNSSIFFLVLIWYYNSRNKNKQHPWCFFWFRLGWNLPKSSTIIGTLLEKYDLAHELTSLGRSWCESLNAFLKRGFWLEALQGVWGLCGGNFTRQRFFALWLLATGVAPVVAAVAVLTSKLTELFKCCCLKEPNFS